jgi:Rps23 Pro-64 3,4-dihydroxylase Tpa1-like proline 4-hydroxylase
MNGLRHNTFPLRCEKVGTQHAITFGMRGPSLVTTVNSSSTPLLQTGKTGRSFLAILAEASANESYGSSAAGSGQGVATGENTAIGGTGTQQGEQLPVLEVTPANREASANAIETLVPADQNKVPSKGTTTSQDEGLAPNRSASESSTTTEVLLKAEASTVASDTPPQFVAARWTRSASATTLPATEQANTATEVPLNAKPSAAVSNTKAQFIGSEWTRGASAVGASATQQAYTATKMPLKTKPSAVVPNTQAQFASAQWTANASATEPSATQQAHAVTEIPINARPSAVVPNTQAQFASAQWAPNASATDPAVTQQAHTTNEMPLNADRSAIDPNTQARFVSAQGTPNASATEPAVTQQAHTTNEMPLNADRSAIDPNIQAQFVSAQWTPNAPATALPAGQQDMANKMSLDADRSAIDPNTQAQFVAAQVTRGASAAELPANQQAQTATGMPLNSNPSSSAAYTQAQFVAAQLTRQASATELPATQQARMAAGAVLDGSVAKGSSAEVTANGTQVVNGPTTVVGEMLQASVEASLRVAFPDNAAVGAIGATGRSQPAKAAELKEAPGTTAPKNPSLTKATDADINKPASAAGGARNESSGAQNSNQSSQNMNGSSDQTGSATARVAASSLPQAPAQTIATSGASHEPASPVSMQDGLANTSRSAGQVETPGINQQDIGEGVVTTAINSAKLIQAMGQTEMRVGLHTSDFGDISIRTSVSQQQMQAQISVDHSELSQTIAAHISSVQTKLGDEHGIQASIQIDNRGSSQSSNSEQSSQKQQNAFAGSARSADAADRTESDKGINLGMLVAASDNHRLDIRV